MAKIHISAELLDNVLFGAAPHAVMAKSATIDEETGDLVLDIYGADVPDAESVAAVIAVEFNRRGDSLSRMTFEAL